MRYTPATQRDSFQDYADTIHNVTAIALPPGPQVGAVCGKAAWEHPFNDVALRLGSLITDALWPGYSMAGYFSRTLSP